MTNTPSPPVISQRPLPLVLAQVGVGVDDVGDVARLQRVGRQGHPVAPQGTRGPRRARQTDAIGPPPSNSPPPQFLVECASPPPPPLPQTRPISTPSSCPTIIFPPPRPLSHITSPLSSAPRAPLSLPSLFLCGRGSLWRRDHRLGRWREASGYHRGCLVPQFTARFTPGASSEKAGMVTSKCSPRSVTI